MEEILEQILVQLTRIADCYENKEKREINEAKKNNKRTPRRNRNVNSNKE